MTVIIPLLCLFVIVVLETSNLISKKDFVNKPARFLIIMLCLVPVVYFIVERNNPDKSSNEKSDSLGNEIKILHSQIDTLNNPVIQKSESSKNSGIIAQPKDTLLPAVNKNNMIFNTKGRQLTDPVKAEFHRAVQHYFSDYNLPANYSVEIICRTGDDESYDFAEKLKAFLKSSGYNVEPIVNKMQLRSNKTTVLDLNSKDNRVEIKIGSDDISAANPLVIQ